MLECPQEMTSSWTRHLCRHSVWIQLRTRSMLVKTMEKQVDRPCVSKHIRRRCESFTSLIACFWMMMRRTLTIWKGRRLNNKTLARISTEVRRWPPLWNQPSQNPNWPANHVSHQLRKTTSKVDIKCQRPNLITTLRLTERGTFRTNRTWASTLNTIGTPRARTQAADRPKIWESAVRHSTKSGARKRTRSSLTGLRAPLKPLKLTLSNLWWQATFSRGHVASSPRNFRRPKRHPCTPSWRLQQTQSSPCARQRGRHNPNSRMRWTLRRTICSNSTYPATDEISLFDSLLILKNLQLKYLISWRIY